MKGGHREILAEYNEADDKRLGADSAAANSTPC